MSIIKDRSIKRGDSDDFTIKISIDGILQDLTGYIFWFTVRKTIASKSSDDSDALINEKITEFNNLGEVEVHISSEKTDLPPATYYYEIQYKTPPDENGNVLIKSSKTYKYIIESDLTKDS